MTPLASRIKDALDLNFRINIYKRTSGGFSKIMVEVYKDFPDDHAVNLEFELEHELIRKKNFEQWIGNAINRGVDKIYAERKRN